MKPALAKPSTSCINPAITTASKKAGQEPSVAIDVKTITARPAAGPLTPNGEPLAMPTTIEEQPQRKRQYLPVNRFLFL